MRFFAHAADPAGLLQTRRLGPPLEKPDAMRLLIVWLLGCSQVGL